MYKRIVTQFALIGGAVAFLSGLPSHIRFTFVNSSTSSDVYRYDFQFDTLTQLTNFSGEYARDFSISPDGQYIVFERAPEGLMCVFGCASDLWMMGIDGSNPHLLVAGGDHPAWSQGAIQMPTTHKVFLLLVKK